MSLWSATPVRCWPEPLQIGDLRRNPALQDVHFRSDGTLLVADKRDIHMFRNEGREHSLMRQELTANRDRDGGLRQKGRRFSPQCMTDIDDSSFAFTDRFNMTVCIYSTVRQEIESLQREIFRRAQVTAEKYPATAPFGIVRLRSGKLAVSDKLQRVVHIVDVETNRIIHRVQPTDKPFGEPTFMTLDRHGRILVSDRQNNNIRMLDASGERLIGQFNAGNHQPGRYRCLNAPGGVVVDSNTGDMLIANNDVNNPLVHVTERGAFVKVLRLDRAELGATVPNALALRNNSDLALTNNHRGTVTVLALNDRN